MPECIHTNKQYKHRVVDAEIPVPAKLWVCVECMEEGLEEVPEIEYTEYEKIMTLKLNS